MTAAEVRSSGTERPEASPDPAAPAPPASLVSTGLAFGRPQFSGLPIAGDRVDLVLPVEGGRSAKVPKGVKVGLRWDPIVLDPRPPAPGEPVLPADPGVAVTAIPGASATAPAEAVTTDAAADGAIAEASGPGGSPPVGAAAPAVPEVAQATPGVDLILPEQLGSVVDLVPTKAVAGGMQVRLTYPSEPGLYRLVPTLHEADGDAFDSATQALLTPVLVRVSGPVAVAYGVPAGLTLAAGVPAIVDVSLVNSGSDPWEKRIAKGFLTRLPATLVATWVSVRGAAVPAPVTVLLDPALSSPGTALPLRLEVTAPVEPGEYIILLDIVSPDRGPLTSIGNAPGIVRVTVTGPDDGP